MQRSIFSESNFLYTVLVSFSIAKILLQVEKIIENYTVYRSLRRDINYFLKYIRYIYQNNASR